VVTAWVQENAGPLLEKSEMYCIGHGLIANIVGIEMVLRSEPLLKIEDQTVRERGRVSTTQLQRPSQLESYGLNQMEHWQLSQQAAVFCGYPIIRIERPNQRRVHRRTILPLHEDNFNSRAVKAVAGINHRCLNGVITFTHALRAIGRPVHASSWAELLFRQFDNFIHSTTGFFSDITKLDG
jgi:hypothetical protein